MTEPCSTSTSTTTRRWWPERDPEPGPAVLAVAVEGEKPLWYRWERTADGWVARGQSARHTRHTPAQRWHQIGDWRHPNERDRDLRPVVDVTADLGKLCAQCGGYGCHPGCGWSGRTGWSDERRNR